MSLKDLGISKKRTKYGLSIEKDGSYTKLMVVTSSVMSGFCFGMIMAQQIFTATWKTEFGLSLETAALFQTVTNAARYLGDVIAALTFYQMTPRQWIVLSIVLSIFSYTILLLGYYFPVQYFVYFTVFYGLFLGLSSGFTFTVLCITPQSWLDKKRSEYSIYLFLGAPLVSLICAPGIRWMVNYYSSKGTVLILIGIYAQQFLVSSVFVTHPDNANPPNRLKKIHPEKNLVYRTWCYICLIWEDIRHSNGIYSFMMLNFLMSGFLATPLLTQLTNILTETGITTDQIALLWICQTTTDILIRPVWSKLAKFCLVEHLFLIDCIAWFITCSIFIFGNSFPAFAVGFVFLGVALSGYTFKQVMIVQICGLEHISSYTFFDQLLILPFSLFVPNLAVWTSKKIGDLKFIFKMSLVASILSIGLALWIARLLKKQAEKQTVEEKKAQRKRIRTESERVYYVTDSSLSLKPL